MADGANPTSQWAELFVAALAHGGLTDVCIAPGSRSTPLTMAFVRQAGIQPHLHLDERSAGFFALGLALATDRPVALVCTSGSAAANFHPAIVEAYMSAVPLLILTTDRPPELRHSGANQTIDQVKMFANHVLWSADLALPEAAAPAVARRNLQTMAARALAIARGQRPGPVHLNLPFRKPLEPALAPESAPPPSDGIRTEIQTGRIAPSAEQINELHQQILAHERGLIVCGPGCPGGEFPAALARLARRSGYPICADPLSGLRFHPALADSPVIASYESFLAGDREPGWGAPELIIRFGAVPISKWLNSYLERQTAAERYHIRANGIWADDSHLVQHFWQLDEVLLCQALSERLYPRPTNWQQCLMATEAHAVKALAEGRQTHWFDGAAVGAVLDALPEGWNLVMGNSLPVRHLDQFGAASARRLHVYGNRGASGIDGNISTALGVAAGSGRPTVLVIGDITFYHDMNGLFGLREVETPVIIVLLNNNGGGIFRRLPIAAYEPEFTPWFLTPHGLDFSHAAALYGLPFARVTGRSEFTAALDAALASGAHQLIELQTDGAHDEATRRQIVRGVFEEKEEPRIST
ncbi:MAG: 2-succinyl-5-enolpyruvyl-6-hydroxy-3-cyclohexene-1-carboxylic-acid synthase, partial [Ardenticatenales bacterium]|nr:2-succinyl-5-enolpyruvyl-6-hydroxy-3-cyclohexene-1-carboxylic-acid synthase [Ardenticatenales bacterium]